MLRRVPRLQSHKRIFLSQNSNQLVVVVKGLACQVPTLFCTQKRAMELARAFAGEENESGKLAERYYGTRIDKRHFVVLKEGLDPDAAQFALYQDEEGRPLGSPPSTAERMVYYARHASALAVSVARKAMADANCPSEQVTHLITVSCTGFDSPGFEFDLIEQCALPRDVGRLHVGFMGCHGSFNAMRAAQAIARADREANVLIVSVELCSVHMQYGSRSEDIVANALFSDGAGACVISACEDGSEGKLVLEEFLSYVIPGSQGQMGWHIRDQGFVMDLKREIPKSIYRHLPGVLTDWLSQKCGMQIPQVGAWGIHPGGPRIVEAVLDCLELPEGAADVSFHVLKQFGNMSSATVFFMLDEMARRNLPRPWLMIGFGPGLSVEAVLIRE